MMAIAMTRSSLPQGIPAASAEVDGDTLARCRERDAAAQRAFVLRYERAVFALLSRILGGGPHVEDLAQETFLRAFRALGTFDPAGAARPSTWLLTIATRVALDARKRRALPTDPLEPADEALGHDETPEKERGRREIGRRIARAASELPDDQRAAFVLAEMHGFTMQEIAAALEVNEATAKTRLFRARERMRAALADVWAAERGEGAS